MFNDNVFDDWLDTKTKQIIVAMGEGKPLTSEEMMVLVLKAQTNHFNHLDVELRQDMKNLREDMSKDMKDLRIDIAKDMKDLRNDITKEMKEMRIDIAKEMKEMREDVNKRFELLTTRMDRFMIWSFATTLAASSFVVGAIKLF